MKSQSSTGGVDEFPSVKPNPATTGQGMTMQTRWRAPLTSANMTDRPGRTGQGSQKARLGLAAEHPVRAGLPRPLITEHHTEVHVSNFNPKDLGVYRPYKGVSLASAAMSIAVMSKKARLHSWREIIDCGLYDEQEKLEIIQMLEWYESQEIITTKSTWIYLRDLLVQGRVIAYAIGEYGNRVSIDAGFWALDAALSVLSTETINIPMYAPRGHVYISRDGDHQIGIEAWCEACDHYNYERYFKAVPPEKFKANYLALKSENSGNPHSELSLEDQVEERAQITRGRRKTFDIKAFLVEAIRIIAQEKIDFAEYGAKKKFTARVRAAYLVVKGKDDLPDDDTLMRDLSDIWKEREAQDGRVIAHEPE